MITNKMFQEDGFQGSPSNIEGFQDTFSRYINIKEMSMWSASIKFKILPYKYDGLVLKVQKRDQNMFAFGSPSIEFRLLKDVTWNIK
jgi:hypothetical protein